jgi:hypothetical protein
MPRVFGNFIQFEELGFGPLPEGLFCSVQSAVEALATEEMPSVLLEIVPELPGKVIGPLYTRNGTLLILVPTNFLNPSRSHTPRADLGACYLSVGYDGVVEVRRSAYLY